MTGFCQQMNVKKEAAISDGLCMEDGMNYLMITTRLVMMVSLLRAVII